MKEVKTIYQPTLSIVSTTALVHFVSLKCQWNGIYITYSIKLMSFFLVSYSETVENRNKNVDTFFIKIKI